MSWSRQQVSLLIEEYRNKPCLYATKLPQYKNKHARLAAWNTIYDLLKEVRPTTTITELKNKMNSLRTNFMSEYRKKLKSKSSGAGGDEIYEPGLWYYDDIFFILDHNIPRKATDSVESMSNELNLENANSPAYSDFEIFSPTASECTYEYIENEDIPMEPRPCSSRSEHSYVKSPCDLGPATPKTADQRKAKKQKLSEIDGATIVDSASKAMTKIVEAIQEKGKEKCPANKDNIDIFTDFVNSRIRMIGDEEVQNDAMEKITHLLFEIYKQKK